MSTRRGFYASLLFTLTLFMLYGAGVYGAPRDPLGPAAGGSSHNVELLGRWASGPCRDVVVVGGNAYIVDGGWLEVLNVSIPTNVGVIGKFNLPSMPMGLFVSEFRVHVADGAGGHRIINKTNPSLLFEEGRCDTPGEALDVVSDGYYAYVADGTAGMRVIAVTGPNSPVEVGFYDLGPGTGDHAWGIAVDGDYAYVAYGEYGLREINIGSANNPVEVGAYDPAFTVARNVVVDTNYAYVAYASEGLLILDISVKGFPEMV